MKTAAGTAANMPFRERLFAESAVHVSGKSAGDRERSTKSMCGCAGIGTKKGPEGCSKKEVDEEKLEVVFVLKAGVEVRKVL